MRDAEELHREFGTDEAMYEYSGWNPFATLEMAEETVRKYIAGNGKDHSYGWIMDRDGVIVGMIGAYDYCEDSIEVGFSVVRECWGSGYATEALREVLRYLTGHEKIGCVTAWCAADNIGSKRALEKAGMKLARAEKGGLVIGDRVYDKLTYEYRA